MSSSVRLSSDCPETIDAMHEMNDTSTPSKSAPMRRLWTDHNLPKS